MRGNMPAAVAADPVVQGEHAGEVLVQGGDAVCGGPAHAGVLIHRKCSLMPPRARCRVVIAGAVIVPVSVPSCRSP